jgi:hypothetical protein
MEQVTGATFYVLGFISTNMADVILHIVISAAALTLGFGARERIAVARSLPR